jgi:hypothetical protein
VLDQPKIKEFIRKNFLYNFTVGSEMSLTEAKKNFEDFKADPELHMIKWYLSQKEYEQRTQRLVDRKSELLGEGKTEEQIDKILRSESAKYGWANRRKKASLGLDKIVLKRDRTRENFIKTQRQSENIEDRRDPNK